MKVLYEKESLRLLGAQIVGGEGVDKRIDVLATAIRAKMTALGLTELDLSYAPPYSSAKDPVNMAGFMIEDLERGEKYGSSIGMMSKAYPAMAALHCWMSVRKANIGVGT